MEMYPLKCRPIFKPRIWGGWKLHDVFGKNLPTGQLIGESWELTDMPDDKTVVDNGPLTGQTLCEVLHKYSRPITGRNNYCGPFPLLIKFIDSHEVLSVQVHPDAAACSRISRGKPKTECWYIIQAETGAVIYKGLKSGTTKQQFENAIKNGTCAELLNSVTVHPGECHFIPAGTCHAIGAGLLIAEIQQPSDTTHRVFDWNRIDSATGKPRPLHIKEALECIHFGQTADNLPVRTVGRLVETEAFSLDKGHRTAGGEVLFSPGTMKAIVFLSGQGAMLGPAFDAIPFSAGDTFLIPAAIDGYIQVHSDCEYLVAAVREST